MNFRLKNYIPYLNNKINQSKLFSFDLNIVMSTNN